MARVLALLGAVLLVASAVLVRRELDDGGGRAGGSPDPGRAVTVACVPELRQVCEGLAGVRIEPPAATIAAAGEVDAWVTFDPWPAVARDVLAPARPVASTDLVLVRRAGTGAAACEEWACAGGAGAALPPMTSALGLLALGNASLQWSHATRPGEPFARQELDLPEYRSWLDGIERRSRDPLLDMLQLGPAGPPATAALATDVAGRVEASRERGNLDAVRTGTVVVVVAGPAADEIAGRLAGPLADAGWSPVADGSDGLPSAGVLRALQEVLA
jgi:hypothetical protein